MKSFWVLSSFILLVQQFVALPVRHAVNEEAQEDNYDEEQSSEYRRYMREIVETLQTDPEFRNKLENASQRDIYSRKIAHELQYVHHNVRLRLDEIKRQELERLRHLATRKFELENDLDKEHLKIIEHLDHGNLHTFERPDLEKLIAQSFKDLRKSDHRRRSDFKKYKMQQKFEREQKLNGMDEEARKKYEEEVQSRIEKIKKHARLHHPGSKQQLEEVWEKEDHMDSQEFNPKTFFYLHDIDGNGFWDEIEVKALFRKDLDRLHAVTNNEDDILERIEEMERMREHMFKEQDTNEDGLISLQEFEQRAASIDFENDKGWAALDERDIFSNQEYEKFKEQYQEKIKRMIANGTMSEQDAHLIPHQNAQDSVPTPDQQVDNHGQPVQVQPDLEQQYLQQHRQQNQVQGQVPNQQYQQVAYQGQPVQQHQYQQTNQVQGQPPFQQYQGFHPIPAKGYQQPLGQGNSNQVRYKPQPVQQQQYQQYNRIQEQVPFPAYQQQQIPAIGNQLQGQANLNQQIPFQGQPDQQQQWYQQPNQVQGQLPSQQYQAPQTISAQGNEPPVGQRNPNHLRYQTQQVQFQQYQPQPIPAMENQPQRQGNLNQQFPYQGQPDLQQQLYQQPYQVQGQLPIQHYQPPQAISAQRNEQPVGQGNLNQVPYRAQPVQQQQY